MEMLQWQANQIIPDRSQTTRPEKGPATTQEKVLQMVCLQDLQTHHARLKGV
jgi:hypothetical protein